jgi:4-hydroxysphinganine ceramide fatty acyl 2-hydroxylase
MSQFIVFYKGNQYDVNAFLDSHPAGRDIILPFEGKDMTEEFEAVGHSKSAMRILNKYLIGTQDKPLVTRREPEENENVVIKKLFTAEDQYQVHKLLAAFTVFCFAYATIYYIVNEKLYYPAIVNAFE